jgi:multicomponent K+:H+ antiporter subunit G
VTLAKILYFSAQERALSLHARLIIIVLSITVPVRTTLPARTELLRRRAR